ncbi:MAG: PHP-associated domain-containing protein [Methanomassiliicoccales archaeon]
MCCVVHSSVLSKADVHVHTRYSGFGQYKAITFPESICRPEEVVDEARKKGVRVLCITDHNSVLGALRAREYAKKFSDIEVVVGEEITAEEGEIIGLFLGEGIPQGLPVRKTIERIRAQGGLVIAPHPFSCHVPALGKLVDELDIDGLEVLNGGHVDGYANDAAKKYAGNGRWAVLAGSDAHASAQIGCCYTTFEGETAEDFRKAILDKRTVTEGEVSTLQMGIKWIVQVVLRTDLLIFLSLFGPLKLDYPDDPLLNKINVMRGENKLLALITSSIFLTPPIPILTGVTGKKVMQRLNRTNSFAGPDRQ